MKMTIKEHILFILLMLVNGLNPIKGYREIKDEDFLKQLNSTPISIEEVEEICKQNREEIENS